MEMGEFMYKKGNRKKDLNLKKYIIHYILYYLNMNIYNVVIIYYYSIVIYNIQIYTPEYFLIKIFFNYMTIETI